MNTNSSGPATGSSRRHEPAERGYNEVKPDRDLGLRNFSGRTIDEIV
jgi:hypothetical protein